MDGICKEYINQSITQSRERTDNPNNPRTQISIEEYISINADDDNWGGNAIIVNNGQKMYRELNYPQIIQEHRYQSKNTFQIEIFNQCG